MIGTWIAAALIVLFCIVVGSSIIRILFHCIDEFGIGPVFMTIVIWIAIVWSIYFVHGKIT